MVPSTATQLLITLVLVVPGFVYHGVLIRIGGRTPADADLSSRLMRAIVASTIFALTYLVIVGTQIEDVLTTTPEEALQHLRRYAIASIVGVVVVPVLAAAGMTWALGSERFQRIKHRLLPDRWNRIDTRPSAWDVAFAAAEDPCFVRVQMKDGTWYAGYFGPDSYASSFPDPPSLFLEISYAVDDEGQILNPIEGNASAVIDCSESVLVEILPSGDESGTMEEPTVTTTNVKETSQ